MVNQTLNQARQALFLDLRPAEAVEHLTPLLALRPNLAPADQRALYELAGMAKEQLGQYDEATQLFMVIGDYYQAGYCQMLKGRLDKATEYWRPLITIRQNHWCLALYGLVTATLNVLPTFLQIRNHLEADIIHLVRAGQEVMGNNILSYVDFLSEVNYEAYKYAGRALFQAGQVERAGPFLLTGQKILPNDPEVYYHLGQYYEAMQKPEEAALMLHQCLLINRTYTPAKELHQKLHASCPMG